MEGRRRREGNAIRQLPYAGRRAGKSCVVSGMADGTYGCRDDLSEEPNAGNPHVRICAGGGPQGPSLPRPATLSHTSLSDKQLPIVVTFLCIFASRTGYPIHAGNIVLPKHQTQLRSMFLNMSHTVQLKLQETRLHPLEYATLLRSLVC